MGKNFRLLPQADHSNNFRDICTAKLREAGCRITKQRIAIIECIAKATTPLSAPEIFESLRQSQPNSVPDKVSVYRVLDTLHQLNLIHRVPPSGAYIACTHQDCRDSHHVLARCTACNEVREIHVPYALVEALIQHMQIAAHFTPNAHLLHMDGICNSCQAQSVPKGAWR